FVRRHRLLQHRLHTTTQEPPVVAVVDQHGNANFVRHAQLVQNLSAVPGRNSVMNTSPSCFSLTTFACSRNQASSGAGSPTVCTFTRSTRPRPSTSVRSDSGTRR